MNSNFDEISMIEKIENRHDLRFLGFTGLDEAIIGTLGESLVYSEKKIISVLMSRDNMTESEAIKFIHFNIESAYFGDETPTIIDDYY